MSGGAAPPSGYLRRRVGGAVLVARADTADAVERAAAGTTLYAYAAAHPAGRAMHGRAPVYAAPLPDGSRVVVRRSRHGGLFAPLAGDRFLWPGRAPAELRASARLAAAGVPTPAVVAYMLYPAGPLLCRSDVASAEVEDADDLGTLLAERASTSGAEVWVAPVVALLDALARAGARHPDLNVKNVLLARRDGRLVAHVLDVDRVRFAAPGDPRVARANARRLLRSARKRRAAGLAHVTDESLAPLAALAAGRGPASR